MSGQNNELPHGWARAKLGDALEFKYGKSLPAKRRDGSHYPVFGSNGIVGQNSEALVEGPVLIIGRKGSIGEIHQSDRPCWPIDTTYFVDNFYDQPIRFWYHRLKALPLTELNRATALPGLNRQDAYDLAITVPPIAAQRRIVAKIDELQERSRRAREALAEVGPLLEQFRQSVLAAAFHGDLTADWRAAHSNVEPASALLHRIRTERRRRWEQVELTKYETKSQKSPNNLKDKYKEPEPIDDSDLPDLPDSWCWASLDDLLAEPLANGRSVKDGNGFPVLRLTALKNRRIDVSEHKLGAWNETDAMRFIVQKGDFLVSRGNGSIDLVGRGGLVIDEPSNQVAYPDTLIRVRVTDQFDRDLLALSWDSAIIRQKIEAAAHTTAGIHKVSQPDLQQIPLPLPPLEEQREIVLQAMDHLNSVERLSGEVFKALNAFDQLDQSILAKAFRGKLVSQDPNDEPASALLARIRDQRAQQAEAAKGKKQTAKI